MKFFHSKGKADYTIIIGCGRLGGSIADFMSSRGESVLVMDIDEKAFRRLSPAFGGLVSVGDGADFDALGEAHMERATTVLAVTDSDNANIMIAHIAREIYHVPQVIVRLLDPALEGIYKKFGFNTICPAELSARQIVNIMAEKPESEV